MEANLDLEAPLDVVVVGGGLAGLVAGITAAGAGARVAVVDTRSFGGRARSAERDGFTLNEGGHALYRGAGGWALLESLGVHPNGVTPDASEYRVLWDGEIAPLPTTAMGIATTSLLGARSKVKLAGWFNDMGGAAAKAQGVSLDEWLDHQRTRPDLRKYLTALGRLVTYSARPGAMPASAVLGQFALDGGVAYLHGGWQSIIDDLVRRAGEVGIALVEHQPVTSVDRDGATWTVTTPDRALRASAVVFAAGGPKLAADLLGGDAAGWVERSGPAQRAACLDIGGSAGDIAFLQSADDPLYLSAHAPTADLAPDGQTLYSVMRYLADDDANTHEQNRAALERHAEIAGLAERDDRLVDRFLAASVVTWGSTQVGMARPSGLELADRGIYAAGDWIGRPLLADASIVSGAASGAAAARHAMVAV